MRFLADQDVYDSTLNFLKHERYDVLAAQEIDLQRASDEELLRKAKQSGRLLFTRDKGFGALAFFRAEESSGGYPASWETWRDGPSSPGAAQVVNGTYGGQPRETFLRCGTATLSHSASSGKVKVCDR